MDSELVKHLHNEDDVSSTQDGLVFDPFNSTNKQITLNDVQSILRRYGVDRRIHNLELYKRAFVHKSYTKRPLIENQASNITIVPCPDGCMSLKTKSNERLEFIGDGVLELVTKYELYRRFPKADEGFMTEKKIALVKNEHIGSLAYKMNLNNWFILSRSNEDKKGRTNLRKLGCLFEAFIGALFLDFSKESEEDHTGILSPAGFKIAQTFILNVYKSHVDWTALISTDDNYKNILQVKVQKVFKTTPHYVELSERDDETGYHMGVCLCLGQQIHDVSPKAALPFEKFGSFSAIQAELALQRPVFVLLGESKHKVKKKAEQMACELAIDKLVPF